MSSHRTPHPSDHHRAHRRRRAAPPPRDRGPTPARRSRASSSTLDRRPRHRVTPSPRAPRRAHTMNKNYSNPSLHRARLHPARVRRHAERSSPSSSRSKPRPSRLARAHLHDGELPRSTPAASFVPFACDDAAAALNMSTLARSLARPSRTTERRRHRRPTTDRRADGGERANQSIAERFARPTRLDSPPVSRARLDSDAERRAERALESRVTPLARAARSLSLARSLSRVRARAFAFAVARARPRASPRPALPPPPRGRRAERGSARGTPRAVGTGGRGGRRAKS